MHRSREGRHTAKLSTWMLRHGLVKDRKEAVKLVQRGKVTIRGEIGTTKVSYTKVGKEEITITN